MTDTKFKYNDHVLVKYGFYRTMAGKVRDRMEEKHKFKENTILYEVKTDVGDISIFVNEDQIELVGRK